ncbi:MAG: hypothetical protein MRY32_06595 [Rickettsiales bacterium]|nr:hypothetical protein [Rickettsiales bacterium]
MCEVTLEQAVANLPTPERVNKGDVLIYEKVDKKSTIPSAQVKRGEKDRLLKLLKHNIIDKEQMDACFRFRSFWRADRSAVIKTSGIAVFQYSDVTNQVEEFSPEDILHRQACYIHLRNPANGIESHELNKLERIICLEETLRQVMQGRAETMPERFSFLVDKLKRIIDRELTLR